MDNIKMLYADNNELLDFNEVKDKMMTQKKKAMTNLKEQASGQMQLFQNIKDISNMVNDNEDFGHEVAENTLDALSIFNADMKILALNAYQLQDLLELTLKENDVMLDWITYLEQTTLESESAIFKAANKATSITT